MTLLEFARGPALTFSTAVFLLGAAWRLYGIFRRPARVDLSEPRRTDTVAGAVRAIFSRMLPRRELGKAGTFQAVNAYAYHLGLFLIVFTFAPHIGFIERVLGPSWAALPDVVTYLATAITVVALLIALLMRLTNPVQKLLSGFDDYFTWFVTVLPVLTGMALIERGFVPEPVVAPALPTTPELLAVHLLSLELMLVWFPFGKLMHALLVFVSRARTGAEFTRKGAAV